jgi:nucleoside-diphosphate-sugar epimerase
MITGITGFLGSHLAAELCRRGYLVGGLVRGGKDLPAALAGLPTWPVRADHGGIEDALVAFRPDVVVHLAALFVAEHQPGDVLPLVRANIEYGACLLDAMRVSGCSNLVYAGTSWQHRYDREYCPVNLYAATKQAFSTLAEYYLDAAGLRLLELHLYDSYGEDDRRKKLINLLKFAAQSADELAMSEGAQRIHLVHVDDLARGVAMACEQVGALPAGLRRVYRLPSAQAVSLRELVAAFNAAAPGSPVPVRWGTRPYRAREVFEPWEAAEVLPGWQPEVSLAEGLRRVRQATGEGT